MSVSKAVPFGNDAEGYLTEAAGNRGLLLAEDASLPTLSAIRATERGHVVTRCRNWVEVWEWYCGRTQLLLVAEPGSPGRPSASWDSLLGFWQVLYGEGRH